jgi:hypothetical protein
MAFRTPNIAVSQKPKSSRRRKPGPMLTARIVEPKSTKRENAWRRYLKLSGRSDPTPT